MGTSSGACILIPALRLTSYHPLLFLVPSFISICFIEKKFSRDLFDLPLIFFLSVGVGIREIGASFTDVQLSACKYNTVEYGVKMPNSRFNGE